ncbi:hypothetical protein B0H19DRAFT_1074608 [Mycena capillaripes]|nr:hypothetical protein B0H19DRAFT_1074608 [Mycena capillaripes]
MLAKLISTAILLLALTQSVVSTPSLAVRVEFTGLYGQYPLLWKLIKTRTFAASEHGECVIRSTQYYGGVAQTLERFPPRASNSVQKMCYVRDPLTYASELRLLQDYLSVPHSLLVSTPAIILMALRASGVPLFSHAVRYSGGASCQAEGLDGPHFTTRIVNAKCQADCTCLISCTSELMFEERGMKSQGLGLWVVVFKFGEQSIISADLGENLPAPTLCLEPVRNEGFQRASCSQVDRKAEI